MSNTPITIMAYTASTTGVSSAYSFDGGTSRGGVTASTIQTICVYGTFAGAACTHQISPDAGTTWIAIDTTNAYATQNKCYNIEARSGATYRIAVTSAGNSTTTITAKAFV